MDNKRKQLYNNLIGTGRVSDVEIGSLDEFQNAIKDERTARQFHKNLLGAGFTNDEIGTEDEFYNSISSDFLNDNESDPFDANVERAKNGEPIQRVSTQSMIDANPELGLKNIPNLPTLKEQVEKSNVRDGKLVFGKPGFNGNEVSALYPMSSETLSNRLSDPRILDKDMSIRSVNEADEEKKIDAFFHSKPMKTAKDVYDNYSARFSNTERGIELGEELSDISRTITDKYANEYFNSDSYKELAKRYQGEELAKKANEEFQKTYGYTIDKELKPYQDAYNNELSIRYGSNMDEALRSIAKESVSGKLNSLTGEVESMLKDSEEKLKQHRSINGKGLNAIMGNQQYLNDTKSQRKERNMLESAQELLDDSQNIVNEASKKGNTTFVEGLARGFWDNLNAEDFTFGLAELADMKYLNEALKKAEQGEQLTPAEEKLLEASTINMATQAYFSSDLGRGYKAGSVTAESIPFMLEFIANPISGSGNAIAKGLLKFGLKRFGKSMTSKTAKAVGRLIGDATAAVGMTSTTGMPSVLAETYNRLNRNYKYGVGEDGELYVNKEGDTSLGEAFGKSFTTRAIENQSEMIFHAFKGAGNLLKGVDATLPGGVNTFFDYIKNSKVGELWRGIKNSPLRKELAEATKVGGIGEEYLEEVYNNFANVALGEMSMEEALNLDNNIDTFLGLAPTQVMFSMLGLGNMAALRYKTRRDIEDLRATMNESQRQALDGLLAMGTTATNQDVREFIRNTMANQSLSIDEKRNAVKAAYDVARQKAMADVQEAEVEDKIAEENADIDAKTDPQTGNYGEVTLLGVDETGEPTANTANVFGAKVVDGELYLLVLPEGETEKKWVRPHEYDAESHQIMPGAEVKVYNEQMIRDNAAKQAEQEAKYAPDALNAQMQQGIPFEDETAVYVPFQVTPEGNAWQVEVYNKDENGKPSKDATGVNVITNDQFRDMLQAQYEANEAAQQQPVQEIAPTTEEETTNTPVATEEVATEDVQPEVVEEVQQPKQQAPVIPTKEDGSIDFVSYGKDNTFKTLGEKYGEKMPNKVAVTAKALAEDLVKAKEKLAKAEEAYDNAPIGREQKAEQARDKAKAELESIQREADFWSSLDNEIKEAQAKRNALLNPKADIDMSEEPMNADEFIAQQLANGNIALESASYKKETGYGEKERQKFIKMFRKAENGGISIESAGDLLMQMDRENGTNFFDQTDANAGRDALINFLGSVSSWGDVTGYIRNNREAQAAKETEGLRSEMEDVIEENYHMTPEEYATLQEMEATENPFEGVDIEAKDAIFAEAALEYEEYLKSLENGQGTTEEVIEGNGDVLSEEQSDNSGGTEQRQGEGLDVSEGTVQSDDTAQEESAEVEEGNTPFRQTESILEQAERIANEEARRNPLRQRAKEWEQKLGVKVHIIENFDDVTNKDAKKAIRNGQRVTGWYEESTGEVCLYMPYLESAQEIDATYIHEVVAHKGLRGLLGDKFDEFLDDVWNAMSEADKLIYLTYPGVNGNKRAAADEYIAHLAENIDVTESAWGKLAELIKKFLKAIGLEPKMTHADIANTIKLSYQRLLSGEGGVDVVGDGTRFRTLEEINQTFNEELQQQIDGTLPNGHIYQLGSPSAVLLSTGIADVPIELNSTRLDDKSKNFGHDYDLSELKDLVKAIHNPMAIFAYGDKSKAQNIIVEIQHEGKNFIVGLSIKPKVGGQILDINSIRNVFPKDNAEWLNWISQGKLLYADKERIQDLINQQQTNLADVDYLDLDSIANIVKDFPNPTIPEEKTFFKVVYHGSGASFDRFDHAFMGTGEGAQAYGWGTYLTDVEKIGKQYAERMRPERYHENAVVNNLAKEILDSFNGDKEKALEYLRSLLNESWSDKKRVKKEIKIIESGKYLPLGKVHLYEVEIPDNNGSNFIDWQTNNSQGVIEKLNNAYKNMLIERGVDKDDISPEFAPFSKGVSGESIYKLFARELGSDKEASKFLGRQGFIGIEYPAQFTTGGRADNAKNYVIFNEKDLEVKGHTRFRVTPEMDKKYMDAVSEGNTDLAQSMVDDVLENVGYTIRGEHGTTHKFTIFSKVNANIENSFGKGFYFTNNMADAEINYASDNGADLTNRIERLAERMEFEDGFEDMDYEERLEEARKRLHGGENLIISAALRMENPCVFSVDPDGVYQETIFDVEENYDEETDEYGEPEGLLVDFVNALDNVLANEEYYGAEGVSTYDLIYDGEYTADQLKRRVEDMLQNVYDEEGNYVASEIFREALEGMGFDGVIDNAPSLRFENMGLDRDTKHYIVFKPNQIKSAEAVTYDDNGNVIPLSERFNSESNDIRFRTLPNIGLRKLEEGEKCNVERVFTQQKMFNFSSGEKIESYEDVAYIFKSLEDEAIENTFVALIKNGKPTIVHLGMGTANQSTIDQQAVIVAIDRIKPDEVYMVHNHPSGNLKASRQDVVLLDSMKKAYGSIVKDGIIINLRSGRYSVFNEEGSYAESNPSTPSKEIPVKTYSFSKRVFDKDFDIQELINVRSADDANYYAEKHGLVAALTSSQRLGDRDKISLLVVDQSGKIVGNVFLNHTDVTPSNMTAISKDIAYYTSAMSGQFAIIFGRMSIKEAGHLNMVVQRVSAGSVKMFDAISVNKDGGYVSAANEGVMEEAVDYANNDTRFRIANQNQEIFVSNAQKAVEGIKQEKATPQQWLAMIEKNGGLKAGEDKWLGLSDWLKASDVKTITKSEILDFINQNKIQIEEVHYEEEADMISKDEVSYSDEFQSLIDSLTEYDDEDQPYINKQLFDELKHEDIDFYNGFSIDYWGESIDIDDTESAARYLGLWGDRVNAINNTRLGLTTKGLENNREIALTVPTIAPYHMDSSWDDEVHFGDAGDGRAIAWIRFGETFVMEDNNFIREVTELKEPYRDVNGLDIYKTNSGSDNDFIAYGKGRNGEMIFVAFVNGEQIPVAHKTLEDAMGEMNKYFKEHPIKSKKKQSVLVIDEIQSKRHQDGRDKGYGNSVAEEKLKEFKKQLADKYPEGYSSPYMTEEQHEDILRHYPNTAWLTDEERSKYQELQKEAGEKGGVPSAPFEKNWHELAFKRMLRYAAENGFDKVAWTTGAQQAERYNLSAVVDHIAYYENEDGTLDARAYFPQGGYQPIGNTWAEVENNVGKDITKKMQEGISEGEEVLTWGMGKDGSNIKKEYKTLSGENLKLGGEGMKGFYDKMLPSFVNKYVKKWGTKVQDIELPELEEAGHIMHSVDVTDAMKESVMEGQTMFRIASQEEVQAEVDKFTSNYNGKEVLVLNSTVSDEELESLGLDVEDVREAIEKETEGFYDPITDKIYIFADIADADELEKTLFHENGHGIFRKNKKFVNEFNENSKDKFKKGREDIAKYYKEHERAEELFVRIFDQELTSGNFEYLPKYLSEELWNEFNDILKDFGYDRQEESDRRRKGSVVRTETDRGSEKETDVRNSDIEPNQREERKEKGRSKEQAERLKKLFDDVADMGLRGVLGNTNYDLAMLDIFYALPEKERTDVAVRAVKIGGDVAVAVDEYLSSLEEPTLWEKAVAAIKNALRKVGIDVQLTENDVKYLLWRSRKPLDRKSIFDMAEDIDMRRKLKVGEFDNDPTDGGDTPGGGTRFRVAKEQIDIADERTEIIKKYDKELESKMFNFQEAFQDRMLSLKVLMDLIENETGKKAKSFEDAYTAENQLGSINRPAQLKWLDEFYKPLLEELNKLSKKYGQKEIERYIYCKSGLERNEVLRQRDADETFEAAKAELDEKLAKNEIDQAQYQILLQQADDERKKTLATDTDYSGIRGLLMNTRADDLYDQYVRGVITEAKYKQEIADLKKNEEKVIKDWKQFAENQVANIEKAAEKAELDALWDKINAATNETLRIDFESGMIDRDTYNAEKKMMKYYVPLRNWENTTAEEMYEYRHDMTQAVSSNQKRAKGRKSQADNPIATIALMAQNAIVRGNRNKMKQKLYSFVANRETSLASVRNVWYVRNANNQWEPQYADTSNAKTEAEIKQIMEQFELDMQKLEAQGDAFKGKMKQGMGYRANRKQKDEHVVTVMINGKEYGIYINGNPRAAQAVNGLTNAEGIDDAGKWIDNLKRYYGAGLTSWNPDFIIPNLVRDSIHAATMTFLDKGTLAAAKYIWNTPKVFSQVFKEVSGVGVNDPKLHQYFEEFVTNGGETGYTAIHTLEDYKKEYDKLMNEAKGIKSSMKNGLKEGISKLSSILEAANRIAEDVNRFNAYVTSREEGYDIVKSIDAAKNITVNFNRKGALASNTTTFGKVASLMSRWILFFNPGVQGIYQLVTKSKLNPKRAKAIGATILASGFFMPMINELLVAAAGGDDEDDYWNQTDFKRRNNWMLFTGDGYVTIPLPPVLRELYGIGDIMYGIMTGHINPSKAIYDTLKQIQSAVGFVNLLPEVSHEPDMVTYVKGFAPDVAAPILDIVTNTNFMGSPIAKWTDYNEFDPEYMRVYKGVSPVWKELSMLLNEVGGEEGLRSNVWGNFINPAMMEHLITSYTGGIGKTINNVVGMALDEKENIDLFRKTPIVPRFYTPNDEKTVQPAINRKYYDFNYEYNRYSKALKKYEKAIESGEHPEWQKYIDEMEKERIIEFINYFKAESKVLKKLTDKLKVDSQNKELESDVYDKKAEIATNSFRILRGN